MDFIDQIRQRQRQTRDQILHNINNRDQVLQKGKPADEGEEREWAGKKYKKTQGKWIPVTKDKKGKQDDDKDKSSKKDDDSPKSTKQNKDNPSKKQSQQQSSVSKQEIGQMTVMKNMIDQDPQKAFEIFESLSPEAQEKVPQDVVNKLVEQSTQDQDDAADKVFEDEGKDDVPTKESSPKSYNDIKDWIGDEYSDEQITSVLFGFLQAGFSQKNLKVPQTSDMDKHYDNVGNRAEALTKKIIDNQITPMDQDQVTEIVEAMIESEFSINDFDNDLQAGKMMKELVKQSKQDDDETKKTTQQIEQSLENGASYDDIIDQYTEDGGVGESVLKEIYQGSAKDVSIPYMKEDGLSIYQVSDGSLVLANPDGDFHAYIQSDDKVKKAYEVLGL